MLFNISRSSRRKTKPRTTIKLEPKTLRTAYLLAIAEVIKFNLPLFPGKPL